MSATLGIRNAECEQRNRAPGVLVCFALAEEARPFRRLAGADPGITILITGIGTNNSERSLRAALSEPSSRRGKALASNLQSAIGDARPTRLVLTCGFAGALNPALSLGAVVFSADEETGLKPKLLVAGARDVRFHCAEKIVATAAAKQALWQATGADVVEMESAVIRRICQERGIPSATVRVISDTAYEDLPLDFNLLMTGDQRLDYAKLVGAVLNSPRKIPALLKLQGQTRLAAEKLAEVLAKVIG